MSLRAITLLLILVGLLPPAARADNTTDVGRIPLAHPNLGHAGGATLHSHMATIFTELANDVSSRYREYTGVANNAVTTYTHNLGEGLADITIVLYSGAGPTKTRVSDPAGAGWTIIANVGTPTLAIDVTAPSSGGPHSFALEIYGSLKGMSIQSPAAVAITGGTLTGVDLTTDRVTDNLRWKESGGTDTVTVQAPAVTASYTLSWPVDDGTTGQVLSTDGSGVLAWITALTDPMTTRGDIIVRDATNVTARLAVGAANRVLRSNGTDPSWSQVAAATDISGQLPIGNGGTAGTTATTGFDNLAPTTARGDLITRDTSNNVRLAVGAANRVLRSNGTDPSWAQVAAATDISGTLAAGNGGTGQANAFVAGGIIYSASTSALASTSTGTAGDWIQANAAGVPITSSTTTTLKTFNAGVKLSATDPGDDTLDYYEEDSFTTTFTFNSSAATTGSMTVHETRLGRQVFLCGTTATVNVGAGTNTNMASNTSPSTGLIAAAYRPSVTISLVGIPIENNNTDQTASGSLNVGSNGALTFLRDWAGTAWTASQVGGVDGNWCVTYTKF